MPVSQEKSTPEAAQLAFASATSRAPIAARVNGTCDFLTEILLYAMLVFSPWAFGTTQRWSISVMDFGGYSLGVLLFVKLAARRVADWRPGRWGAASTHWTAKAAAALTVFLLLYCLVSALNSRASFDSAQRSFTYRDVIPFLPHSYDSTSTWRALRSALALALSFWAVRDWLLTRSPSERQGLELGRTGRAPRLPSRLRRLLWVLTLNGGLLALEGLVQRTMGTSRLLWIIEPRINKAPEAQFGPYAYRSNAVQYLLLVWPAALGFWFVLRDGANRVVRRNNLLPCILVMAMAPLFALSRAGAILGLCAILIATALLLWSGNWSKNRGLVLTVCILGLGLVMGALLEWPRLSRRFANDDLDSNRWEIWQNTFQIVQDFPAFGTGPGTFGAVYHLYRANADEHWAAYAHNDWLELLMTFGGIGFGCILVLLGGVLATPYFRTGIVVPRSFCHFLYLALGTCLVFAVVDFPFRTYSVFFLFIILCGVLMSVSPRREVEATKRPR